MGTGYRFEQAMKLLFGKKADDIAGSESTDRKKWLQNAVRKLQQVINTLDTTPSHKEPFESELESIMELINNNAEVASWDLVYRLFRLSSRLLGFNDFNGGRSHSLVYFQTSGQYYSSRLVHGGDALQESRDKNGATSLRVSIVKELKAKGYDEFMISLVLNTTEYEVKKMRSNSAPKGPRQKRRAE